MLDEIKKDAEDRMKKTIASTKAELIRIRTGRATTALLDHLSVDYYGNMTPINQVATVSVSDARTLSVRPWEKQMLSVIERAILESDLGLNPVTVDEAMRIPLPPMTEERRVELVKIVKNEGENGKIAVRNIRRDAISDMRDLLKEKEISEDAEKQAETDLQTLTDKYVENINQVVSDKEKEVMEV